MATLGKNMRWSAVEELQPKMRAFFEVLNANLATPMPDLDLFTLSDGANIGVYYCPPSETLSHEQHRCAAWTELEVEDEAAATEQLAALDIHPFDYFDKEHNYFQAPNGQVFRLATAT